MKKKSIKVGKTFKTPEGAEYLRDKNGECVKVEDFFKNIIHDEQTEEKKEQIQKVMAQAQKIWNGRKLTLDDDKKEE